MAKATGIRALSAFKLSSSHFLSQLTFCFGNFSHEADIKHSGTPGTQGSTFPNSLPEEEVSLRTAIGLKVLEKNLTGPAWVTCS